MSRNIYKWFPTQMLACGSAFELPIYYVFSNPTDIDLIVCDNDLVAVSMHEDAPSRFTETTLRIVTEKCHIGFVKLVTNRSNGTPDYFLRPSFSPLDCFHGPAFTNVFLSKMPPEAETVVKECFPKWIQYDQYSIDTVYAVYCPNWPQEAIEWKHRVRKSGCPPENAVQQIMSEGCHLVAKAHQANPHNDTEWRYSFSKAEIILINTWTYVQKYIYHILRLIKSEVAKEIVGDEAKALHTYYFKTLMFWAIEEKTPDFWSELRVELSIHELLCELITRLIDRNFPHYFIRDNNMIDHLPTPCIDRKVKALVEFDEMRILKITSMFPKANPEIDVTVTIRNSVALLYLIQAFHSSLHDALNSELTNSLSYKASESVEIVTAQKYLYKAIEEQLRISKLMPNNAKSQIQLALKFFRKAVTEIDNRCSTVNLSPKDSFYEFLTKAIIASFNSCSPADDCRDVATFVLGYLTAIAQELCCIGRSLLISKVIGDSPDEEYASKIMELKQRLSCFVFLYISQSATIRRITPMYITVSVYEANFYYVTLKDYGKAIAKYDEFLSCMERKHIRLRLLEITARTFPVIITNSWIVIFDQRIQCVFGFLTLCKAMFSRQQGCSENKPSSKTIILRLCPVLLFMYIRFQSEKLLRKSTKDAAPRDFNTFQLKSIFNRTKAQRAFSRLVLFAALRSSDSPVK